MTDEKPLLTSAEVAARLKVQPTQVRKWTREGFLEGTYLGANAGYRYTEEAVAAMLRKLNERRPGRGKAQNDPT
jgi:predicted site-specific integrase-resolvase